MFYALGRSRVPVALSAVSVTINLVLSLMFVPVMGFRGLALATSVAALANAALCVWLLRVQLDGIGGRHLATTFAKVSMASAAMSAAVFWVNRSLHGSSASGGTPGQAAALVATIVAGLVALGATARVLGVGELDPLYAEAQRRIRALASR